jgi:tRNA threonylcarbamoyladenosine biosynthesis protein TsaB
MTYVLYIETSGEICSVALSNEDNLVYSLESEEKQAHAAILTKQIEEVLHFSHITIKDLSAVAVSKGPGSYTGLRIGVSTAKGICYAQNIPLIAINTLESLAKGILENERNNLEYLGFSDSDFLCIMTDARRMEVYTALFNAEGIAVSETTAMIVDETMHESFLRTNKVFFAGSGAEKASSIIKHPNAMFLFGFKALATNMISSAFEAYRNKKFENVAYFEPYYLKDFFATKSKKDILK